MKTDIFLHIPKTGGTTLHSLLTFQYMGKPSVWLKPWRQSKDVYERRRGKELDDMSVKKKKRLRLVRGHVYYGVHQKIPNDCSYVAFVRDPVKHVRSQYKYFGLLSRQNGEESVWTKNSMKEILKTRESPWLDNMQVRWLSGAGLEVKNVSKENYERAVQHLEEDFSAVGVTEKFDASLVTFAQKLGWIRPLFYRRANVQNHKKSEGLHISDMPEGLIKSTNKWDLKIYKYGLDRLAREKTAKTDQRIRRLEMTNTLLGPFIDAFRGARQFARHIHS